MSTWRAVEHPDLRSLDLDSCVMVLNPFTWETHYLTAFIGAIFLSVMEKSQNVREIALALAEDESDISGLSHAVEAALQQLASFDLVRKA